MCFHNDKPPYVYTSCKLVTDLRTTKTMTIIGGFFVPADVAAPPASIASILGIQLQGKSTHLFDVTGLATMSTVRNHETKYGPRAIVDITVIDSSKTPNGKAAEIDYTIYFNVKGR